MMNSGNHKDEYQDSDKIEPSRRDLIKSIGTASVVGTGVGLVSRPASASVGCNDQYWSEWDGSEGGPYNHEGYVGTWITGASELHDGYYKHCFRVTSHRIGRGSNMTGDDDKVYDIEDVTVSVAEDFGVRDVNIEHYGASPGSHENSNGYGSPDYEGNPFKKSRDEIAFNTGWSPELNDWHYDRYEEGGISDDTSVRFSYNANDQEGVADHANQVVISVITEYHSDFAISDHGVHAVTGEPAVHLTVDAEGTNMSGQIEPSTR
jgi:hypothetical protein